MIRLISSERVYLSGHQSMSLKAYLHTSNRRAETTALLDCGATENFINEKYACRMHLPVRWLATPRKIINVDGTPNRRGDIQFYTNLELTQGKRRVNLRFFLTEIGDRDLILGYPWFAAVQPAIDWARGWIETEQLPVILKTEAARKARFLPQQVNVPRRPPEETMHLAFVMFPDARTTRKQTVASQLAERAGTPKADPLPLHYRCHTHVFSEKESQRFPNP